MQARGLVAELGVQRAESAIPGGTAGKEQLGKVGALRGPVRPSEKSGIRLTRVWRGVRALTCLKRAKTRAGPCEQRGNSAWL